MNGALATKGSRHKIHVLVNGRPKCGAAGPKNKRPAVQLDWCATPNCKRCVPPPPFVPTYEI